MSSAATAVEIRPGASTDAGAIADIHNQGIAERSALARRCGFREVGVYESHGRLDGEWKDLLIVERLLGDAAAREA